MHWQVSLITIRQILPGAVNAVNAENERERENVDRNRITP